MRARQALRVACDGALTRLRAAIEAVENEEVRLSLSRQRFELYRHLEREESAAALASVAELGRASIGVVWRRDLDEVRRAIERYVAVSDRRDRVVGGEA